MQAMLNFDEADLKAAIVQKAADEILRTDSNLYDMVNKEIHVRINKIFAERAEAAVAAAIDAAVANSFEREYQRVTAWGEPTGPKTSIRAELLKTVAAYWSAKVDVRSGRESDGYGCITRAEYLMTQVCAKDFTDSMKEAVTAVTGALKDGLRTQLAQVMDSMLNDLFRVKSLQDQGKAPKPY